MTELAHHIICNNNILTNLAPRSVQALLSSYHQIFDSDLDDVLIVAKALRLHVIEGFKPVQSGWMTFRQVVTKTPSKPYD